MADSNRKTNHPPAWKVILPLVGINHSIVHSQPFSYPRLFQSRDGADLANYLTQYYPPPPGPRYNDTATNFGQTFDPSLATINTAGFDFDTSSLDSGHQAPYTFTSGNSSRSYAQPVTQSPGFQPELQQATQESYRDSNFFQAPIIIQNQPSIMDKRLPSSFQQLEKLGEGTYATVSNPDPKKKKIFLV